jgi:hypothetical protein
MKKDSIINERHTLEGDERRTRKNVISPEIKRETSAVFGQIAAVLLQHSFRPDGRRICFGLFNCRWS